MIDDSSVTHNIFTNQFIAGMAPYESRVALCGRTGGAYTTLDADNLDVDFQNALTAGGPNFHWIGPTGNYTDATKWTGGIAPGGADDAVIATGIANSSGLVLAGTGSLTVADVGLLKDAGTLRVGGSGVAGTLNQTGGGVISSSDLYVGDAGSNGSTYTMTGGTLTVSGTHTVVGRSGVGSFSQDAGTTVDVNRLFISEGAGSAGSTWTMNGGTLNINATNAQPPYGMEVGRTEAGTFTLNDGTLNVNNGQTLEIGYGGNGTFEQNGGTVNASGRVQIGDQATSDSLYTLSSGQLNVTNNPLVIGVNGKGTLTQTGGSIVQTGGNIYLGDNAGSEGTYNLANGASLSTTGELRVGNRSKGTVNMTDGTVNIGGSLRLAPSTGGGDATVNQSGGTVTVGGRLELTDAASSTSTYNLSGDAVLNANGDYAIIGRQGPGHFVQSGDSAFTVAVANRFLLADISGAGGSTYTISDNAELNVLNGKEMSLGKSATGTFTQNGGTVNATGNIRLGEGSNTGVYNLNDGVLNVNRLLKGSTNGDFNFNGGALHVGTVDFTLQQDGGVLAPGQSPGITTINGNYDLNAGTLEIELNGTGAAGTAYDQLVVNGLVNLATPNALLDVVLGYVPTLRRSVRDRRERRHRRRQRPVRRRGDVAGAPAV